MKNFRECLVVFVIAMGLSLLGGCADPTSGSTAGLVDGSSGSDGSSSPETNINSDGVTNDTIGQQPDTGPPVDVCAPYMYLQGTSWTCHAGAAVAECVLVVTALESGVCDVKCPKVWHVDAATILFPSADKLVYDLHIADAPAVPCFKKVN